MQINFSPVATCPRCKKSIDSMAPLCPHCGYDFPLTLSSQKAPRGLDHSDSAGVVLGVGAMIVALGAVASLVVVGLSLLPGNWLGFFSSLGSFFVTASLYIVFQRALDDK